RSTVGTATEIHDYLRLLWARVGQPFCPVCDRPLRRWTPQSAADAVLGTGHARGMIAFPLRVSDGLEPAQVVEMLRAQGFVRLVLDDRVVHIDELGDTAGELARVANAAVIVDRVATSAESRGRIVDAFETAFREGSGDAS